MIPTLTLAVISLRLRTEEALQNRRERLFLPIAHADLVRGTPILLTQPADGQFLPKRIDAVEDGYAAGRDGRNQIRKVEVFQRRRNDLVGDALMNPLLHDGMLVSYEAVVKE